MKFTDSHEWIQIEDGVGTVGITEHAQRELGAIVYIELPSVGKQIKAGEEVAVLESTKAAADIYAPVSGEVIEINQTLCDLKADAPADVLGRAAEQEGWLFKVKLSNHDEIEKLLSKEDYLCLVDSCK